MPSRLYSRHTLMQLLDSQQRFLLETIDGVRNVRELAILHGLTDELVMADLQHLAMLEIIYWMTSEGRRGSTEESLRATSSNYANTPLPLDRTHDEHTLPAQPTVSSLTPLPGSARRELAPETHPEHPHVHQFAPLARSLAQQFSECDDIDMDTLSLVDPSTHGGMDWEDFCIPDSPQPARPQHQLPPPSTHTPLPLYRPAPQVKKQGPFTPNASRGGLKPTIKKS